MKMELLKLPVPEEKMGKMGEVELEEALLELLKQAVAEEVQGAREELFSCEPKR